MPNRHAPGLRGRRAGALLLTLGAVLLAAYYAQADSTQILIARGLVTQAEGDGADLFFRGTFSGNGRTCGSCHPVANNLTIDPPFIATLPSNDPLFVAEFPPPQGVPGLERPVLMRGFGLILENVDGAENPTVKFTMRGVPHTLSVALGIVPPDPNPPIERTGWSGDGAPETGALNLFAKGAVFQHFTKTLARNEGADFVFPTQTELNSIEAYMRATGRLNELNLSQVNLLNSRAQLGRRIFENGANPNNIDPTIAQGKCAACHVNAGANLGNGTNGNFDTGVENVPHPARDVEDFPFDGGLGLAPRDCDGDGVNDCFGNGTFNAPSLIEAADTPPFFHNNVSDTLEDAVEFYSSQQFQDSPSGQFLNGISLTTQESADVAAFLRVVNASFNIDMSIQRNNAAITLENSSTTKGGLQRADDPLDTSGLRDTVNAELFLSNVEAADAIEVLNAQGLHPDAVVLLQSAIDKNSQAIEENSSSLRKSLMKSAVTDFNAAKAKFGTGLTLQMGRGNLLF